MKNINFKKNITYIKTNKWIILASIFFLVWKFFLIHTLWQGRITPPEPDDSYIYIAHIKSIKDCPTVFCEYPNISLKNTTGFAYLSYRILFGIIAKILHTSATTIFHLGFYIGTIILLPVLIYLANAFTKNKTLIALIIFFLALYNGSGSYHGFFWIVPSFFATLLFLLILGIILKSPKYWYLYLLILIPIFIFIHPTSVYTLIVFPIFFIFYSLLTHEISANLSKKIILLSIMTLFIYGSFNLYIHKSPKNKLPLTNLTTLTKISKETNNKSTLTIPQHFNITTILNKINITMPAGWKLIKNNYFLWILPHWLTYIPFLIIIFLIFYNKQFKILSIYLALIIFILISSFHKDGYRALAYIWPITYILYGVGFYDLIIFIKEKISNNILRTVTKGIVMLAFLAFIIINLLYSYIWNKNMNTKNNVPIPNNYITYLKHTVSPGNKIIYSTKILYAKALNSDLMNFPMGIADSITDPSTYFVFSTKVPDQNTNTIFEYFFNTLSIILSKKRAPHYQPKQCATIKTPKNLKLIEALGNINIYKKN